MKGGGAKASAKVTGSAKAAQPKQAAVPAHAPASAAPPHHETGAQRAKLHRTAVKAAATRKRNAAKRRGLSPGGIALCPAEAVAQAARLAGWAVTGQDVLDLYARCADGPSSGFTIAAALTAGLRPAVQGEGDWPERWLKDHAFWQLVDLEVAPLDGHALILGVDLPGPHAVTIAPDGTWWSWGEPFDPDAWPDLVIEEAWAVIL